MDSIVPLVIAVAVFFGIEVARWKLRPEGRRLRILKKLGGRR